LGGIEVGVYAMVAAGALVTKNVPNRALVKGSPARICAWLNNDGTKMIESNGCYIDNNGNSWRVKNNELVIENE
jgi:serine acetyltransferase